VVAIDAGHAPMPSISARARSTETDVAPWSARGEAEATGKGRGASQAIGGNGVVMENSQAPRFALVRSSWPQAGASSGLRETANGAGQPLALLWRSRVERENSTVGYRRGLRCGSTTRACRFGAALYGKWRAITRSMSLVSRTGQERLVVPVVDG
jgi:hypothetical protein